MSETYFIFVRPENEFVPVNKAIHDFYYSGCDKFRREMSKRGSCKCPRSKYAYCNMECDGCRYRCGDVNYKESTYTKTDADPTEYAVSMANLDAAFFLAYAEGTPIGFAQCQLRHDYVEGTSSSPVGYLEGIYVLPDHRHEGIAKQLLKACESWAKSKGCSEFASDCELTNTDSLRFHLNVGFEEANRIICFTKKI